MCITADISCKMGIRSAIGFLKGGIVLVLAVRTTRRWGAGTSITRNAGMNMTTRPDCGIIGSRAYRATHFMIFCSVTETYMNRGAESAAEIREAIRLRRELYIFDQFVE